MSKTRRAKFQFSAEIFAELFRLPPDSLVTHIEYDHDYNTFTAYFTSEQVPEVPEGAEPSMTYLSIHNDGTSALSISQVSMSSLHE